MPLSLTEKAVAASAPGDHTIRGARGLILRVLKREGAAVRSWRLRGKLRGASKVWTLGGYPAARIVDVRKLHADCRHALDHGEDPQPIIDRWHRSKIPEAASAAGGPTVKAVVDEFLTVAARKRKRPEAARATLESNIPPALMATPVAALRKRHFVELLDRIVARGSPVQANRVQALLRQAFAVAADRDLIESVPAMPRAPAGGEETPRERVLGDAELVQLWHGLDALSPVDKRPKIGRPFAIALKLLLVTAKWSDIVDETAELSGPTGKPTLVTFKVWNIPTNKSDRPHAIPLSPLACRLLEELRTLTQADAVELFPSARTGKANAERDRSLTRAARTAREKLAMPDWTPHDLRRTARTGFARLGVPDAVGERILNHAAGDRMTAIYNRHGYLVEMREALDKWAARIEMLAAEASK